ncbi:MAG TPA: hypothetical protein VE967_18915 [Gemmatimonadaceae bacterium]|nr:hypothetical protein [Gemmatimonadaceae bacterium]
MKIFRAMLLLAAVSTAGFAQGRGRGHDNDRHGPPGGPPPGHVNRGPVRTTYTYDDRRSDARIISRWYGSHPVEYRRPSHVTVFRPGYDRRIVRHAALPRDFRAYVRPVPYVLVEELPPVRPGWEYVLLDDRVLLIDRPSWMVIDVVVRL